MQDSATISTQISECTKKANSLGPAVVAVYSDEAQSGKTDDREHFRQMLSDAKRRHWEIVIVRKFDRFARNEIDARVTDFRELGPRQTQINSGIVVFFTVRQANF